MALDIYLVFAVVRFIYRWIRYIGKLSALKKIFHQIEKSGVTVTYKRKFREIVFGKKGTVDVMLAKDGQPNYNAIHAITFENILLARNCC